MHLVLFSLIVIDCALIAFTSFLGITLGFTEGTEAMTRHLLMGLFSAMLTCFIHVLVMFYLIGTGKDVRDAVEDHDELKERFVPLTRQLKRRAFPVATLGISLVIIAALMGGEVHGRIIHLDGELPTGGEVHSLIIRPAGELPFREVTAWWVHLVFVVAAVASNVCAFCVELRVVKENRGAIDEINRVLEAAADESS